MVNINHFEDPAVYGLTDAHGGIFYVGSTKLNAQNRLWEHIYRARAGHSAPVYERMRLVGIENVRVAVIAREGDPVIRRALEVVTIAQLLAEGHSLCNRMSIDGVENSMAPSSRALISRKKRGKPTWIKGKRGLAAGWTPDRRRAQSERMKARAA